MTQTVIAIGIAMGTAPLPEPRSSANEDVEVTFEAASAEEAQRREKRWNGTWRTYSLLTVVTAVTAMVMLHSRQSRGIEFAAYDSATKALLVKLLVFCGLLWPTVSILGDEGKLPFQRLSTDVLGVVPYRFTVDGSDGLKVFVRFHVDANLKEEVEASERKSSETDEQPAQPLPDDDGDGPQFGESASAEGKSQTRFTIALADDLKQRWRIVGSKFYQDGVQDSSLPIGYGPSREGDERDVKYLEVNTEDLVAGKDHFFELRLKPMKERPVDREAALNQFRTDASSLIIDLQK